MDEGGNGGDEGSLKSTTLTSAVSPNLWSLGCLLDMQNVALGFLILGKSLQYTMTSLY